MLGSRSQVLDVGRTHRLVTPGLWHALVARDHHCAFPGCSRLPHACDAHHLQHWADGGPTALHNLVLLCRHHHTTLHTTPWRVTSTLTTTVRGSIDRPGPPPPTRTAATTNAART